MVRKNVDGVSSTAGVHVLLLMAVATVVAFQSVVRGKAVQEAVYVPLVAADVVWEHQLEV